MAQTRQFQIDSDASCAESAPIMNFLGWTLETQKVSDVEYYRYVYRIQVESLYSEITDIISPSGKPYSLRAGELIVSPLTSGEEELNIEVNPMTPTDENNDQVYGVGRWFLEKDEIQASNGRGSGLYNRVREFVSYGSWKQLYLPAPDGLIPTGIGFGAEAETDYAILNYVGFITQKRTTVFDNGNSILETNDQGIVVEQKEDKTFYQEQDRRMICKLVQEFDVTNIYEIIVPDDWMMLATVGSGVMNNNLPAITVPVLQYDELLGSVWKVVSETFNKYGPDTSGMYRVTRMFESFTTRYYEEIE